ncbi:MAG: hypothetical protein AAGC54_07775 [Cyanobacteria bacterium P01_F01_bin.4]
MSTSPFSTLEEFNGAIDGPTGGAIYTFAHTPAINNIALVVSVGLFLWFIARTYAPHDHLPSIDRSLNSLAVFVVAGLLSLFAADYRHQAPADRSEQVASQSRPFRQSRNAPLGVLGMVGLGLPTFRRTKSKRRKRLPRNLVNR